MKENQCLTDTIGGLVAAVEDCEVKYARKE
jgi:hypothetical protein